MKLPAPIWLLTHASVLAMAVGLILYPDLAFIFTTYSAYGAVGLLLLAVSITPLKTFFPQSNFFKKLGWHRREFGVSCFFHSLIHVICFVIKRGSIQAVLPYFLHPVFISVLWIAFPIFLVMAITSNDYSVKKLGLQKWKGIHKYVYLAQIAVLFHVFMLGEYLYFYFFVPILLAQIISKRFYGRTT